MGCFISLFSCFKQKVAPTNTYPDVSYTFAEHQLSTLLCHYVKKTTSGVPFKIRCIVLYYRLYNIMASVFWRWFYKEEAGTWASIVGSYAENSCVSNSDVDFLQCSGIVFCDPFKMHLERSRGLIVHTDSPEIPPGCCWLRLFDKRDHLPWSLNTSFMYQDAFKCNATKIDGHTHYPHKTQMDKVICYRPANVERSDGFTYFSSKIFSDFHSRKGLTEYEWINKVLPSWLSHGPAFTQTYFGLFEIDVAISFHCFNDLPDCANEIFSRQREHNWPTEEMLFEIKTSGFDVVPIPSKITLTEDSNLEWRISFRNAETKLVRSFSECQMTVYRILKVINKEIIEPKYPDEDFISSYIMKTLVFWTIEKHGSVIWENKRLLLCFRLCLNTLREWISEGYCPNYFIPKYNLFRTKIDRMTEVRFQAWILNVLKCDWALLLTLRMFKGLRQLWQRSEGREKRFNELIVETVVKLE